MEGGGGDEKSEGSILPWLKIGGIGALKKKIKIKKAILSFSLTNNQAQQQKSLSISLLLV